MSIRDSVVDISIEQEVDIEVGYTYVVVPTSVLFLNNIMIESKKKIPNYFFKPTVPFDYSVPRLLRIAVTRFEKYDEYCSQLSTDLKTNDLNKYVQTLDINELNMRKLWELLKQIKYKNSLIECDSNISENEKKMIESNVLMTADFDYMTIVFKEPIKENQKIKITYYGKNIKSEQIQDNKVIDWSWKITN